MWGNSRQSILDRAAEWNVLSAYWKSHDKGGVEKAITSSENNLYAYGKQINEPLIQINQRMV